MKPEIILLTHPYRYFFAAAWTLFGGLFLLGFAQGQSFFTLVLGIFCLLAAVYSATAATEISITPTPEPHLQLRQRPISLRTKQRNLKDISGFATNANRPPLDEDDERLGYHHTRPIAYDIELILANGRRYPFTQAHTEESAKQTTAQLNRTLKTYRSTP